MKLKIKLVLIVAVIALFASVGTVLAGAPTTTTDTGPWEFNTLVFDSGTSVGSGGDGAPLTGIVVIKDANGHRTLSAVLEVETGNAYTVWGIDSGTGAYRVAGRVAASDTWTFSRAITEDTFELHVIDHGPTEDVNNISLWITTPSGGCAEDFGDNDCRVAVIPTPS